MTMMLHGSKPSSLFTGILDPEDMLIGSGSNPAAGPAELTVTIGLNGVTPPVCGDLGPTTNFCADLELVCSLVLLGILDNSIKVEVLDV